MNDNNFLKRKEDADSKINIIQIYLPYWPLFIILISLSLGISVLLLKTKIPFYVVKSKVSFQEPNNVSENKFFDPSYFFGQKKILESEIATLGSVILNEEVIKSLHSYIHISKKSALKIEDLPTVNLPLNIEAVDKEKIVSSQLMPLIIDWNKKYIVLNGKVFPFNTIVIISNNVYKISANPTP